MTAPQSLAGRCATCRHWQGDAKEAARMFAENPISMSRDDGWANAGGCGISGTYCRMEIRDDACGYVAYDACHGCIWHEPGEVE